MAVIHQSSISPTKLEFADAWLDQQPWAPEGPSEMIGGYRFDDPAGEVGVEGLLLRRGDAVLHLPVTYRGAPLAGGEEFLVTTMTHTALGDRWVYLAAGDPVARAAYWAFLTGQQTQAALEVHAADGTITHRDPVVTVIAHGEVGKGTAEDLELIGRLGSPVSGTAWIEAVWPDGRGTVAVV